ncbi:MAG: S8 family serine peptidase [Bacteroidota bacterium]
MAKLTFKYNLRNLKPHLFYDQVPASKFTLIKSVLIKNIDQDLHDLLAEPQISQDALDGKIEAYWTSHTLSERALPITKLSEQEYDRIKSVLNQKLDSIKSYASGLLLSEKKQEIEWGQLLSKAIKYPADDFVFIDNERIAIVAWGFEYLTPPIEPIPFEEGFPIDNNQRFNKNSDESEPFNPDEEIDNSKGEDIGLKNNGENETSEVDDSSFPSGSGAETNPDDPTGLAPETNDSNRMNALDNEASPPDANSDISDTSGEFQDSEEIQNPTDQNEPYPIANNEPDNIQTLEEPQNAGGGGRSSWSWWEYLWRILVAILLFLLIALLFSNLVCSGGRGTGGIFNPGDEPVLPNPPSVTNPSTDPDDDSFPKTTLEPIDPGTIVTSPDSVTNILPDRLNVALQGNNQNLEAFASAFKSIYPSDDYRIIYSDPKTFRVQLKVPIGETNEVARKLKSELTQFKLLIWHESIFTNNKTFNDPGFGEDAYSWFFEEIQAFDAWQITEGSQEVIVAVLDGGFDINHPELKDRLYNGWNASRKSQISTSLGEQGEHGTHVAATAAGISDNNEGVSGIAPGCRIMPIVVADERGTITSTYVIDGILYAMNHGAKVINMSLGMYVNPDLVNYSQAQQEAIIKNSFKDQEMFWDELFSIAEAKNISVVLAGGNQDVLIGIDPLDRSNFPIRVSATRRGAEKAVFSNWGIRSDISAPGENIYSAAPNGAFQMMSGTSMAAPIVAGAAALMFSAKPDAKASEVKTIFMQTGKPTFSPSGKQMGNLIQIENALSFLLNGIVPEDRCTQIEQKIDSLNRLIQDLKDQCSLQSFTDTMRIPKILPKDVSFAKGRWKSSSPIENSKTKEVVELYFDFIGAQSGKLTLVEADGNSCKAVLNLSIQNSRFVFDQQDEAKCPTAYNYNPYHFSCIADKNGKAICQAQNKVQSSNTFEFTLIKIK